MSRFYVPRENVGEKEIFIDGREAHHILDVMRLREGDSVVVFDGTGNEYSGTIEQIDSRSKTLKVGITGVKKCDVAGNAHITLAQAIPKRDRMDNIVEKSTELGVGRIIPMVTQRTIVRTNDARSKKKVERWRKIAVESAKQCGRADVTEIDEVTGYDEVISAADGYDLLLFAYLSDKTIALKEVLSGVRGGKIMVFIGPEGDFSPNEVKVAENAGCRFVSLGSRVLRSDTAGLFVLSALNYELS